MVFQKYLPASRGDTISTYCANARDVQEALFYIDATIKNNWSRSEMDRQIESNLSESKGKALTNFDEKLPTVQGELATELLKSSYQLDFLPMGSDIEERKLEDAIAKT